MGNSSLHWRYAVKQFDAARKIPEEQWNEIEESLVLTPSSFGLQPWKFIVITSPEIKAELQGASWNQTQPRDCSHMIALAAMKQVTEEYVDSFLQSICSGRGVAMDSLAMYRQVVLGFLKNQEGRHFDWATNQVYIALGQLMSIAASMQIDACPMEGIVRSEYDRILGLEGSNFGTVVGCALGYRHSEDKYALAKKIRFPRQNVIEHRA